MPSGSKRRKSSKKTKPQGDTPELEAGLEGAMGSKDEEVGDTTPSPKGIEGDPEAMAERGLEGNKVNAEVPHEGYADPEPPKEDCQTDEAVPDQDVCGQGDSPSQAEPEPEILSSVIEPEAPAVFDSEGEQKETEPQIDTPLMELESKTDATSEVINPELGSDAVPVESEPVADATPDAAPDEIKPDADIGLDEIESSKESAKPEREFELDAAPIGSDSAMDESFLGTETIEPEIDKTPDEFKLEMDAAPPEVELEIGETLVQVKPETDAAPYIDLQTNEGPDEVELETDGAPAEIKPDSEVETAAPAGIDPETEETLKERELVTDTGPKDVEAEAEEAQVEETETAAPAVIEPETEEALMERELVTDTSPMDVEAEVEEALAERGLAVDAATADGEPTTDAAPVDTKAERDTAYAETDAFHDEVLPEIDAERDTAYLEIDAFHDEVPPEIDAASPENETETDVTTREFESEADGAVVELELPTEVSPQENEPEMNVAPEETKQDELSQAEIKAAPEPETEEEALIEGETEVNAGDVDLAEDTFLERLQEFEPESEAEAIHKAELEDEASVRTKGEERGSVETESDQQDLVEGDVEATPQINPEPEGETTREIELDAEAEVSLEAEPESVVEGPAEPEEKGLIKTESDQQDLGPDQSGVKEQDQQLQKLEGEAEIGELDSSVCEDNQPQAGIAAEVPVIEDEPPAISASDEANSMASSTSRSEASDNKRSAIEQEPEKGNDIPPATTILEGEGESIMEVISDNQDSGGDVEQIRATAVDNEQGAADELPTESKVISEEQERAVDVGHDEDGTVVASSGNGGQTEESSEQELAMEVPPVDVVEVEESAKEDISEQEKAVDVGHGEDGAVLASAGNGSEVEVASEQELGIELPLAGVIDAEELDKEAPAPSDQELVTKQTQPLIDEQELTMGLGDTVDEPPAVESEQSLNSFLSSSESKTTSDAPEPHGTSEHEFNLESATGELERDIGEEEAASSTVAEVGSFYNDFDDRGSCVQEELLNDFPSTDQDHDIPDCKDFDDALSTEAPESVEIAVREQLDSEPPPAEKVDANTISGSAATFKQEEVLLENAESATPAENLHSVPIEEMPSDEHVRSSPQPEQVVQDSGKGEVHSSKEVVLANDEQRTAEEERAACEDDKVAANSMLGTSFPITSGDELISKAFKFLENGQQSLSPSNELVEHRDESKIHHSEANNMDKAEIHAMDSKELKEAEHNPMGGDTDNDTGKTLVESDSPISEGRDMKGVQIFRQESTQEASLPVVIPAQDRALELVNPKSTERPNGGGTLKRRTKLLDCCGMFDLLLRKN